MSKKKLTLTDTHLVILSTASARPDENLIPLPECVGKRDDRIDAILDELVTHFLAEPVAGVPADRMWRTEDDQCIGLVITPAGLKAIGVETDAGVEVDVEIEADSVGDTSSIKPTRASSKQQQVIDMLSRESGATLAELCEMSGWLKHSASAVLTGLRKKGHPITRDKRGEETCYYIKVQG